MKRQTVSFQHLAYILIVIVLGFIILKQGKFILIPFTFSALFAIMVQPLCNFFERIVKYRIPAILLTLLSVIVVIGLIITLVSVQLTSIINNLENITGKISEGLEQILDWLNNNFDLQKSDVKENIPKLVDGTVGFVQKGVTSVTTFIFSLFFVILLVFFFLLYNHNFRMFILHQASAKNKENWTHILHKIQGAMRKYLYGLFAVIGILAVLNSVGLLIIGIDYAIFWGVLAAFLAIIPYIGTTLGGTLPFLYGIATTDSWWQPAAVVGMYVVIQNIEGNIITPKVVGSSVSINPLVALVAIIVGGFIWGISGIILAIPLVGVIKIILNHNDRTIPLAFMLSNRIHKNNDEFWDKVDKDEHRLR